MRTETVSFPGADRKTINCLVYRPSDDAPARASVFLIPGRPLFPTDYEWLAHPLVEAGYVVVGIYQRGYGSDGIDDRSGPNSIAVLRRAASTLLQKASLPEPVVLVGHASGAQTALLTAAHDKLFATVVALSPMGDLAAHVQAIRGYLPSVELEHRQLFGPAFEDEAESYRARSPVHFAQRIEVPVLLVTGECDTLAPPYQAEALRDALQETNEDVRCVTLPWLGHYFEASGFHGYQFEPVLEETLAWLDTHLPERRRGSTERGTEAMRPDELYETQAEASDAARAAEAGGDAD